MNYKDIDENQIVCSCHKVECGDIREAAFFYNDLEKIIDITNSGTGCRRCISKDHDPKNTKEIYLVDFVTQSTEK